jgi:IS30 family transposase
MGYRELSPDERVAIQAGIARGARVCAIAAELGRSASTISRELDRWSVDGVYLADRAEIAP